MKSIEKFFPSSEDALISNGLVVKETKAIAKDEYDGYLAAFGPSVIISGLIQTLAVYNANEERQKVLNTITCVAGIENTQSGKELLDLCISHLDNKDRLHVWREQIINASVALKILIRTYNLNK